jgi:hypothetical protein
MRTGIRWKGDEQGQGKTGLQNRPTHSLIREKEGQQARGVGERVSDVGPSVIRPTGYTNMQAMAQKGEQTTPQEDRAAAKLWQTMLALVGSRDKGGAGKEQLAVLYTLARGSEQGSQEAANWHTEQPQLGPEPAAAQQARHTGQTEP